MNRSIIKRRAVWLTLLAAVFFLAGCAAAASETTAVTAVPEMDTVETEALLPETIPPTETTVPLPVCPLSLDDWRVMLVNRDHPVPDDPDIPLSWVRDDIYVDSRCYEDLEAMLGACSDAGLIPIVCSGYRDLEYQTRLFQNKISRLRATGMSEQEAQLVAQTIVAIPGTSEHHIGLAVDIVDQKYQILNEQQEQTPVQQWLIEHSWEYGFILRYPNGKSDITGIIYEPWHYRYVGREVAAEIQDSGLCLEEYLEQFQPGGL
ncbi:MAG: M15 family metallopeptidase [Oscillospiraceae bacterium]|nr:M15 family metallopeptidase [Oscillospiraceae bacterium]